MAYSRKFQSRQKGRFRRKSSSSWYNKRYSTLQLAQKALKGVRYIRGLVNSEMFHYDTTFSSAAIVSTGANTHLTALAQGDSATGRTGNSILLRSLTYRFRLEVNSAVTLDTGVTVIIFIDTQQVSDTSPAVTDVLTTATCESLLNLNAVGRFKILSRKTYILTPASGGRPAIEVNNTMNLYKHVRYNGTASTDVQKNGLYVMFISSEPTNTPVVTGAFRIGYHDN